MIILIWSILIFIVVICPLSLWLAAIYCFKQAPWFSKTCKICGAKDRDYSVYLDEQEHAHLRHNCKESSNEN